MFIRATCTQCKSRDVMHFKHNANRLDQFCRCGFNLTAPQIAKQVRTRRLHASNRAKTPLRRELSVKSSKSINLSHAVIFGLLFVILTLPFMSSEVTYAKEVVNPLSTTDLSQNLPLTAEEQYRVLEDIKVKAFEIKRQLELRKRFETADEVRNYVLAEAKKAGVWVEKVDHIARRESRYNPNATGDTHITCPRTGKPIRARGVFQITDCYHPDISDVQAYDVEWSTRWALEQIATSKELCKMLWTECRSWYKM